MTQKCELIVAVAVPVPYKTKKYFKQSDDAQTRQQLPKPGFDTNGSPRIKSGTQNTYYTHIYTYVHAYMHTSVHS